MSNLAWIENPKKSRFINDNNHSVSSSEQKVVYDRLRDRPKHNGDSVFPSIASKTRVYKISSTKLKYYTFTEVSRAALDSARLGESLWRHPAFPFLHPFDLSGSLKTQHYFLPTRKLLGFYHLNENSAKQVSVRASKTVEAVVNANKLENSRLAIRAVFKEVKILLTPAGIPVLEILFQSLDYDSLSTDVVLALLTITIPVKDKVEARKLAYTAAERLIEERNEPEDDLLLGL